MLKSQLHDSDECREHSKKSAKSLDSSIELDDLLLKFNDPLVFSSMETGFGRSRTSHERAESSSHREFAEPYYAELLRTPTSAYLHLLAQLATSVIGYRYRPAFCYPDLANDSPSQQRLHLRLDHADGLILRDRSRRTGGSSCVLDHCYL